VTQAPYSGKRREKRISQAAWVLAGSSPQERLPLCRPWMWGVGYSPWLLGPSTHNTTPPFCPHFALFAGRVAKLLAKCAEG